jgi:GTP pyrophosphokinase
VEVEWDIAPDQLFNTTITVQGTDRKNLLIDLISILSEADINITNARINTEKGLVNDVFSIEVKNLQKVQKAIKRIRRLKGVVKAFR